MKFFVIALFVAVAETYDKINLDEVLKSDRLFKNYYNCLNGEGPCTPHGSYMKKVLPEALETNCVKCSERQQTESTMVIKRLTEHRQKEWKDLKAKFDPDNKFIEKYKGDAEKDGISP